MAGQAFSVHQAEILPSKCGESVALATGIPLGNLITAANENTAVLAVRKRLEKVTIVWAENAQEYDHAKGTSYANAFADVDTDPLDPQTEHRYDIVSVTSAVQSDAVLVGAIDSRGHGTVSALDAPGVGFRIEPPKPAHGQWGWAGIEFSPENPAKVATAQQYQQAIHVYDGGALVRTFHTAHPVQSLAYMPLRHREPLLLATEHNQMSVWDVRMGERGGLVKRVMPCAGSLYCVASNTSHVIASGVDRVAYFYDPRKWCTIGSWKSVLKHEVARVFATEADPKAAFAFGKVDGEFGVGSMAKSDASGRLGKNNFRGDSRWVGVAKIPSSDDFIGITASGTLYGLKGAVSLVPGSAPANQKEGGGEKRSHDADAEGGKVKRVHADEDGEPRS